MIAGRSGGKTAGGGKKIHTGVGRWERAGQTQEGIREQTKTDRKAVSIGGDARAIKSVPTACFGAGRGGDKNRKKEWMETVRE